MLIRAIFDGKVIIPLDQVDFEPDRVYELEFRGVVDESGKILDVATPDIKSCDEK